MLSIQVGPKPPTKTAGAGFTLVELMIVVAIIGLLAAVAIASFMKYIRRAKTAEATMNIRKLYDATVAYYVSDHADSSGNILAKQFPDTHTWDPVQGACCSGTTGLASSLATPTSSSGAGAPSSAAASSSASAASSAASSPASSAGSAQKCSSSAYTTDWTAATWRALNFSMDDPFYYSYQANQAIGTGAAVNDRFDLQASGDLNCNEIYSLFTRSATVATGYTIRGGAGLFIQNELE